MWIPRTEAELIEQLSSGELEETGIFDCKRELSKKSKDVATDVAAMAVDGGVLLYGVGEDPNGRPAIPAPFDLKGQAERITSIVRTCIAEPPTINIVAIPTSSDPALGYLAVEVPPSPRAPHMVIVGGENRYYGRGPKGNIVLTEGEVSRLYQRRERWEQNTVVLLDQMIQEVALEPQEGSTYLYLAIRPLISDEGRLERSDWGNQTTELLKRCLQKASGGEVFKQSFNPRFSSDRSWQRRMDGWESYLAHAPSSSSPRKLKNILDLQVRHDGSGILVCGRAADQNGDKTFLFEAIIAGLTAQFLAFYGELYQQTRYIGPVDVRLAVTGMKGTVSYAAKDMYWWSEDSIIQTNDYRRTERALAGSLTADYRSVAEKLVLPLVRATTQSDSYNPFE